MTEMIGKPLLDKDALADYEKSLHSPAMQCGQCGQCDVARTLLQVARSHAVAWADGKVSFT